jgi:hypothetical protein
VWYLLGMLIPTSLGAWLGARLMRWQLERRKKKQFRRNSLLHADELTEGRFNSRVPRSLGIEPDELPQIRGASPVTSFAPHLYVYQSNRNRRSIHEVHQDGYRNERHRRVCRVVGSQFRGE